MPPAAVPSRSSVIEVSLFEAVAALTRAIAPDDLVSPNIRAHRRGIKVWFDVERPKEHYEAQFIPPRYVEHADDGTVLEVGFHAEHPDPARNQAVRATLGAAEERWRIELGPEPEIGAFLGNSDWLRISECWLDPDTDDDELAFAIASRLVDYVSAIEALRDPPD